MENDQLEAKELKTYEVGFLLSPFLPLEKVEETVEAMYQAWVLDLGGEIVVKHAPKMRTLAYPVAKFINNKKSSFKEAYFAAVKFKISPEKIRTQKELIEKDGNVIRFLVVIIPKNSDRIVIPRGIRRDWAKPVFTPGEKVEKGEEMSSEQIDKEIEGLLETPKA
ncbi:MAG: 30S ribosomal protein S6 [Candidatus Vogelbacteria bacterium]|nr:30S ribosomal protein S6 [Candidatus Vogelbacteria bacterium]